MSFWNPPGNGQTMAEKIAQDSDTPFQSVSPAAAARNSATVAAKDLKILAFANTVLQDVTNHINSHFSGVNFVKGEGHAVQGPTYQRTGGTKFSDSSGGEENAFTMEEYEAIKTLFPNSKLAFTPTSTAGMHSLGNSGWSLYLEEAHISKDRTRVNFNIYLRNSKVWGNALNLHFKLGKGDAKAAKVKEL